MWKKLYLYANSYPYLILFDSVWCGLTNVVHRLIIVEDIFYQEHQTNILRWMIEINETGKIH